MPDPRNGPEEGATRFAADGTLEVFDGTAWAPYEPLDDDGLGVPFKGGPTPPSPGAPDPAAGDA